jgi:hypothetical protein
VGSWDGIHMLAWRPGRRRKSVCRCWSLWLSKLQCVRFLEREQVSNPAKYRNELQTKISTSKFEAACFRLTT